MSQAALEQNRIAKRYAGALAAVAVKPAFAKALQLLAQAVQGHDALRELFKAPTTSKAALGKVVDALCSEIKAPQEVKRLCQLMAVNRRVHLLSQVSTHYDALLLQKENKVQAKVESASKLDASASKALAASLSKMVGKDVVLDVQQNPALLAGFVVHVGASRLDYSLEGKLQALQAQLKANDNG